MNLWPTCLRVRMLDTLTMGGGEFLRIQCSQGLLGFCKHCSCAYLLGELTTLLLGKPWDFCYFHIVVGVSSLLDSRKLSSESSKKKRLLTFDQPYLIDKQTPFPAGNQANESSPASTNAGDVQ